MRREISDKKTRRMSLLLDPQSQSLIVNLKIKYLLEKPTLHQY